MSIKNVFLFFAGILLFASCSMLRIVKGDGNIVTNQIQIEEYDELEIAGPIEIEYTQSDAAPGLTVTVDQNIYEMYDFKMDGRKLIVSLKDEFEPSSIFATKFVVTTNSKELKKVSLAGSITFNANTPLKADQLVMELAGSGEINLKDSVMADKFHVELGGSATLNAAAICVQAFEGAVAGSGTFNLGGIAESSSFEIAGSGKVYAFGLQSADLRCEIAGSGRIEASVSNSIHAEVAGSGHIKYKGNPTVSKEVSGIGSVDKVD